MPVNGIIKENEVEKEMRPKVIPLSEVEVLVKIKSKFRGKRKGVEEDWKLLETLGFLSDFRDVTIPGNDGSLGCDCGIMF